MKKRRNSHKKIYEIIGVLFLFITMGIIVKAFFQPPSVEEISTGKEEDFYEHLASIAQSTGKKYNLFPSVILAQAALESGYGKSQLAREYHNLFGVKATTSSSVTLSTTEVEDGNKVKIQGKFQTYPSIKASFKAYGKLVGTAPRYERVRMANSPEEAAHALYQCGYSTNPNYGNMIIKIIERDNLKKYD
ncbi:MAG: glucosaminidase domain-containing protein [Tissierellia bacterium]|nr:glucosaminidase domain-containing protein [Tissierellia bacterium]